MDHINQNILERYVLEDLGITHQRREIERHLIECAGCAALYQEMIEYYSDVQTLDEEQVSTREQSLTLRSMIMRIPSTDTGKSRVVSTTLPARVVLFVIRHYLVTSFSTLAVLGALLLFLYPGKHITDKNPNYARAKNEFLVAMNNEGEEVWRKHIGIGYDQQSSPGLGPETYLATMDIDGDSKNEVMGIFGFVSGNSPLNNAMACYNAAGTQRWKNEFHRQMIFGKQEIYDDYLFTWMVLGNFGGDGKLNIAAIARHRLYWPTAVVIADPRNGRILSEYWNSGWFHYLNYKDIDRNGVEELFLAGENNSYDKAAVVVLDPRHLQGHAPSSPQYTPQKIGPGIEKYYLLLPWSDLHEIGTRPRAFGSNIDFRNDGLIEVQSQEIVEDNGYALLFYFDNTMRCIKVRPSDRSLMIHRRLEAEGKVKTTLNDSYLEELRRNVLYWDGDKFVHECTMNKHYVEAISRRPLPQEDHSQLPE